MAKNAIVKKGAAELTNYAEQLAQFADSTTAAAGSPSGSFISFQAGQISIGGNPVKGNSLDVIVVDAIWENVYYKGKYDPNNKVPPDCYAFAREDKDLAPHPECTAPQAETCAVCPLNVFGSSDTGGKACKNVRRLALLAADGADLESGEILYAKIPVTSVKGWLFYVKGLKSTMARPHFAVVTNLSTVPDPKSQFRVVFQHVSNLEGPAVAAAIARYTREVEENNIMFPYSKPAEDAAPATPAKPAKFAAKPRK
jgi:hypothetical protein